MAVGLTTAKKLLPIEGITLSTTHAGVRKNNKDDMALVAIPADASIAAVFTTNKFSAAPVAISKTHLSKNQSITHLLINAGNANAGTGEQGTENALQLCNALAKYANTSLASVLPFSTGVIGEQLPVAKMIKALPVLVENLGADNWLPAAEAIMTTDTVAKAISKEIRINNQTITITGIAKGSGMICPNMATMLSFIATDATISQDQLAHVHNALVEQTFNSITVDGDTSTNDAAILIASNNVEINEVDDAALIEAFESIYKYLAQAIIRDAEGATKFITITIKNAYDYQDAKTLAYDIAHSLLVKTAFYASDANWGRILAVIGRSKLNRLDIGRVNIFLNALLLFENGEVAKNYSENKAAEEMEKDEITLTVDLNAGQKHATIWTSDLSHDYVTINAEYRT